MSGGRGYEGGRTRTGTKVVLNIYDLSPANDYLYSVGMGLHHSGVEVSGKEYSFASGGGVFDSPPREAPGARFRESIELGAFDGGPPELRAAISDLREEFGPDRYNLVRRNCNHFANALAWRLLGRTIPGHVNRLADLGACLSCCLPRRMLEGAPVGPGAGGGDPGFRAYGRPGGGGKKDDGAAAAFAGSGSVLNAGGQSRSLLGSWGGNAEKKGNDSLTDRREKARAAALARMNGQGQH